ncbi:hypothetical protein [Nostoc sp.]
MRTGEADGQTGRRADGQTGKRRIKQCPILLFLGYANDFVTSLLRLRQRRRSVQVSTSQYKCPMPIYG